MENATPTPPQSPAQNIERREYPRYFVRILVDFAASDTFLFDYSNDLSGGGVFIQTDNPMEIGKEMDLRFTIPGMDQLFQLRGQVVWINKAAHHAPPAAEEPLGDSLDDLLDGLAEASPPQPKGSGNPTLPPGMGIKFLNITDEERAILKQFLSKDHY